MRPAVVLLQLPLALLARAACAPQHAHDTESLEATTTASAPAALAVSAASAASAAVPYGPQRGELFVGPSGSLTSNITWPKEGSWFTIGQPSVVQWTWKSNDSTASLAINLINDDMNLMDGMGIQLAKKVSAKLYSFKADNNALDDVPPGKGYQIFLFEPGFYTHKKRAETQTPNPLATAKLTGGIYAISHPFEVKARGELPTIPFPYSMPTAYPTSGGELGMVNGATARGVGLEVFLALGVAGGAALVQLWGWVGA